MLRTAFILLIIKIVSLKCYDIDRNITKEQEGRLLKADQRIIDLTTLGIDLRAIFDGLLSPAGIVNQFAISLSIQLMQSVGYLLAGKLML